MLDIVLLFASIFFPKIIFYIKACNVLKSNNFLNRYYLNILDKPDVKLGDSICEFKDNEYNEFFEKFKSILINNWDKDDLKLFFKNMNSLDVLLKSLKIYNRINKCDAEATYNVKYNNITIGDLKDVDDSIYHELFHMASSCSEKNKTYSGFLQVNIFDKIGNEINEGYTDLLANRYFGTEISYKIESPLVRMVEKVVGREKMELLYLNADLKGLYNELLKYSTEKQTINFINNMDTIKEATKNNDNKLLGILLKNIIAYLYLINKNKLKNEVDNNIISADEYIFNLNGIKIDMLALVLIFKDRNIDTFLTDEIKDIDMDMDKIKKLTNVNIMYFC